MLWEILNWGKPGSVHPKYGASCSLHLQHYCHSQTLVAHEAPWPWSEGTAGLGETEFLANIYIFFFLKGGRGSRYPLCKSLGVLKTETSDGKSHWIFLCGRRALWRKGVKMVRKKRVKKWEKTSWGMQTVWAVLSGGQRLSIPAYIRAINPYGCPGHTQVLDLLP